MALPDALADLSNDDLDRLAAGIDRGDVPDDRVARIADLLADDPAAVTEAAADAPAVEALVEAVEDRTGRVVVPRLEAPDEGPGEILTEAARRAIDRVESLLEPAGVRSADFFFGLREALDTGDADFAAQLTQDSLDAIPAAERERLAERADALGQQAAEDTGQPSERGDDGQPESVFGVPTDQPRDRDAGGRPDPRAVGQAGLADRFPQPTVREEFFKLESARRNAEAQRGTDVAPGRFFDEFADELLGNHALSREEFVEAEESPDTTGFFT